MKYISKAKKEPTYWQEYCAKVQASGMSAKEGYEASDVPKARLLEDLVKEQGAICCYCMRRIQKNSSAPPHIEHYLPQSLYPALALDYKNLLAVCQGRSADGKNISYHCDHENAKSNQELNCLDPRDQRCESAIRYRPNGKVDGQNNLDVEEDIQTLNLNSPVLVNGRRDSLKEIEEMIQKAFKTKTVTKAFIQKQIERYSSRDSDGCFKEYCQAIVYVLKKRYLPKAQ
ncbi:hypothetical protein AMR42_07840 [Limnothrix sp. PR1529]|uniref:retron system putative HNH endonuclease n=1 Tax=Limnothrix sp. PR1529 TaxID=1704291 RepID=UPI00081E0C4A|nr:retron system putative HNH endonuclease [Limnothrix sp. PR1529]OCQ92529.1 TIGR02646 family protein [Limnothrix sp. P13C2]PIB14030.1 hypothetical protein AMR42_07840 [Limnothrix sp. PR1529]